MKTQLSTYEKIAFGGFALSVALLLVGIFYPELIFGSVGVLAITGTAYSEGRTENQGDSVHIKPSVEEGLTRIAPSRFVFTQFMMKSKRRTKPKDIVHRWGELSNFDRQDTINGVTTAGSAGLAKTITVDNGSMWRVDDVFVSLTNATDTNALNMYWIESISGNDLDVRVLPQSTLTNLLTGDAYGTVPAFADAEVIYWLGNRKSQSFTISASRLAQPAYQYNFVQTFEQQVRWSDHKNYQENWGPKDVRRYRRDNLKEFRKNIEYSSLFNRAPSVTVDPNNSNELAYTMGGAYHFASSTVVTLQHTGGVPTEAQGVDFVYAMFDDNNGSGRKVLMGGKNFMKAIDKINTSDLNTKRSERVAGVFVKYMEGRIGQVITAYHPGFDEMGRSNEALCLDFAHISLSPFSPLEKRKLALKGQGTDADGEYYTWKLTYTIKNADAHKRCVLA